MILLSKKAASGWLFSQFFTSAAINGLPSGIND
jgi:hypothetical protein